MITFHNKETSRSKPAGLLRSVVLALFVSLVLLLGTVVPSSAQIPGRWESTVVCTKCLEPAGLDFENSLTGVISLESQQVFLFPGSAFLRIYVTFDGGATWQMRWDTVTTAITPGDEVALRNGHLLINSWVGGTLHSSDYGHSIETFWQPASYQLDFFAAAPSTLMKLDRANWIDFDTIVVSVSRDSGRTFSTLGRYNDTSFYVVNAWFRDSSEFWLNLQYRNDLKPRKSNKLIYTKDQGASWFNVYPLDTAGPLGTNNMLAGLGSYREGLVFGVTPGVLYLLGNGYWLPDRGFSSWDFLVTTDDGASWSGDTTPWSHPTRMRNGTFMRNSHGTHLWFVHKGSQTIAYSADNGSTWDFDSVTFKDNPIRQMIWKDSVSGYAISYSKDSTLTFWKYVPDAARVEHIPTSRKYMRLVSTVASRGTLRVVAMRDLSGSLEISDVLGRVVWTGSIDATRAQETSITVPASPGVYVLRYSGRTGSQSISYVMH